jgi:hypothetical protein
MKAKVGVRPEDPIQFVGYFGPSLGFRLHSAYSTSGNLTFLGQTVPVTGGDQNVDTSFLSCGLQFGAGAEYKLDEQFVLTANVRYDLGLTNILSGGNGSLQTRDWQILFGARYRL